MFDITFMAHGKHRILLFIPYGWHRLPSGFLYRTDVILDVFWKDTKKEGEDMVKVGLSYEEGCYRVRKKSYCRVDKIRCIE